MCVTVNKRGKIVDGVDTDNALDIRHAAACATFRVYRMRLKEHCRSCVATRQGFQGAIIETR
jgi:hypothetical protein